MTRKVRFPMNAQMPVRYIFRAALLIVAMLLLALGGCAQQPAVIDYEQVGACNGLNNLQGAGPNLAFLFFRIQDVDSSKTSGDFTFAPSRLWINSGDLYSGYQPLVTAQYASALSVPPLTKSFLVTKGSKVAVNKYVVFLVETVDANGATEANSTNYFLLYNSPTNEFGKLLAKTNSSRTSWPNTPFCSQIQFPR
jgi:hypothetical protein